MNRTARIVRLTALGAAGIVSAQFAIATDVVTTRAVNAQAQAQAQYQGQGGLPQTRNSGWTDAEFAAARPLMPQASYLPAAVFDFNAAVAEAANAVSAVSVNGSEGGANAKQLREERPVFVSQQNSFDSSGSIGTQAVGTGGINFTSTQTFPNDSDTTYPTRTVGKLYFRDPATNVRYVCSGSMIKKGVVLTSGHCIHNGSNRFYTDFVFRPGLRGGVYPYGTWSNWVQGRTTTAWATGGGGVPNTADWATIVFGADSSSRRIGDYTGWLGYQTNICSGRHQTTLGYPVNLDSGLQMHRSDSLATSYGSANNCTWGTDMTGGSSGGPVALNFQRTYTNSNPAPSENNSNRVVATVSWGYTNPAIMVQGGSILNSVFDTLITNTCSANPAAC